VIMARSATRGTNIARIMIVVLEIPVLGVAV
jgi:hypothetical protein